MLDAYQWGKITKNSPEAPVPVINISKKENRLGGAANVAKNIRALGAKVRLCSSIGLDISGEKFKILMKKNGLTNKHLIHTQKPTTTKTRIIADNKHIVRIDEEDTSDNTNNEELLATVKELINTTHFDIVILQDYNKGLLNKETITPLLQLLQKNGIKTVVDPKFENFNLYKDVDLIKPNLIELNYAIKKNFEPNNINAIANNMRELSIKLNSKLIMVTLSENGITILDKNKKFHTKGIRINPIDVSGAGDTVVSIASLCLAQNLSMKYISEISNYAGAQVCEKVGVVTINKNALLKRIKKVCTKDV